MYLFFIRKYNLIHCAAQTSKVDMKVKVISILEDNYMYLVIEEQSKQAVAVDPAVPHRVRFLLCMWENIISV